MKIAVNISGIQLLREDFIDTVLGIIQRANNKNINLELEITESVLLDNYEIINERLKTFNELQIDIALDDFGTGYSSFSRLIELNIDTLKIDKYFINRICSKECNEVIVADIISMAHKLGLNVVAEGVENEAQKRYLINHGCDIIQGYLFSRPLSKDAALQLLKSS